MYKMLDSGSREAGGYAVWSFGVKRFGSTILQSPCFAALLAPPGPFQSTLRPPLNPKLLNPKFLKFDYHELL